MQLHHDGAIEIEIVFRPAPHRRTSLTLHLLFTMANVHGLFSGRKDEDSSDEEDSNNRFVGGIDSRGGGR